MKLKSLVVAITAVIILSCAISRAQPQNITDLINEIKSNMDRNLDPCDDFYEFACGGFIKTHPLPTNSSEEYINWPTYEAIVNQTVSAIRKVVEQPWPIINDLYRSCDKPLEEILREGNRTYREWSERINATSLATSVEIWQTLAQFSSFSPFFSVSAEVSSSNSEITYRGPELNTVFVYLYDEEWNNATRVAEFLEFAELAFSNDTKLVASEKAKSVVEVARYVSTFRGSFFTEIYTIANASRVTGIDWQTYFHESGVNLKFSDKISIDSVDYFKNLTKYVTGLPEQTLKNYLQFFVYYQISELTEFLGCYFGEDECEYFLDVPAFLDRSGRCALLTSYLLNDLVNFAITEETDPQSISGAQRVFNGLREATNASLPSLKWITTSNDLKAASNKIQGVVSAVGTTETSRYEDVETQPESLFANMFEIQNHNRAEFVRESYRAPNESSVTDISFFDVKNTLSPNLISVPATLLNSTVFSVNWPKLFQFAKLGGLIGRQFVHAIDEYGQEADFAKMLFSENTTDTYRTYTECVASVYVNQTFENTTIPSNKNLVEDIADIGGLRNSFGAYHAYIARYGKEFPDGAVIPGFTTDQVFFLISAQMSCSVQNEEYTKTQVKESPYAPNKIRTNGAVSQSIEFAKAYNCPANSPMAPARRCNIF